MMVMSWGRKRMKVLSELQLSDDLSLALFFREEFTSVKWSNRQPSIYTAHHPVYCISTLRAKLRSQTIKW